MKNAEQLEEQVKAFNSRYKTGDKVMVEKPEGMIKATVKHPAEVLQGHSAVGWFEEISGCYSLDKVR